VTGPRDGWIDGGIVRALPVETIVFEDDELIWATGDDMQLLQDLNGIIVSTPQLNATLTAYDHTNPPLHILKITAITPVITLVPVGVPKAWHAWKVDGPEFLNRTENS
jgi:hypothetical protein